MKRILITTAAVFGLAIAGPATAQDAELPYWVSIDAEELNMRAGPSERYPIEWTYHRHGLPLKVIRFHQGWRYVEEPDGTRGWMYNEFLSRRRTALVIGEGLAAMREGQSDSTTLLWNLEPGVIGELGECIDGWCQLNVEGRRGWVDAGRLWGDGDP